MLCLSLRLSAARIRHHRQPACRLLPGLTMTLPLPAPHPTLTTAVSLARRRKPGSVDAAPLLRRWEGAVPDPSLTALGRHVAARLAVDSAVGTAPARVRLTLGICCSPTRRNPERAGKAGGTLFRR